MLSTGPLHHREESRARLPVEFAHAAVRYGHGQIHERCRLHRSGEGGQLFPDLLGFRAPKSGDFFARDLFFDSADG